MRNACRDITELIEKEIFEKKGIHGKGVHYILGKRVRRAMISRQRAMDLPVCLMSKGPHKGLKGLESLRCYHSDVNPPGQLTHICNI
jgi:hypothetical protein